MKRLPYFSTLLLLITSICYWLLWREASERNNTYHRMVQKCFSIIEGRDKKYDSLLKTVHSNFNIFDGSWEGVEWSMDTININGNKGKVRIGSFKCDCDTVPTLFKDSVIWISVV